MTSLQSRPIQGRPWNYQFYADLEGHPLDDAGARRAARRSRRTSPRCRYLGCYPASPRPMDPRDAGPPWADLLEASRWWPARRVPGREPSPAHRSPRARRRPAGGARSGGDHRLYSHQAALADAARTGNSLWSPARRRGKSLAFNLPVLHALAARPQGPRDLPVPDQGAGAGSGPRSLARLAPPGAAARALRRRHRAARAARRRAAGEPAADQPRHAARRHPAAPLGAWAETCCTTCEWVVVDEAHAYRGVFGAHVVNVLARLRRLCEHVRRRAAVRAHLGDHRQPRRGRRAAGGRAGDGDRPTTARPPPSARSRSGTHRCSTSCWGVRASTLGEAATLLAGLVTRGAAHDRVRQEPGGLRAGATATPARG